MFDNKNRDGQNMSKEYANFHAVFHATAELAKEQEKLPFEKKHPLVLETTANMFYKQLQGFVECCYPKYKITCENAFKRYKIYIDILNLPDTYFDVPDPLSDFAFENVFVEPAYILINAVHKDLGEVVGIEEIVSEELLKEKARNG